MAYTYDNEALKQSSKQTQQQKKRFLCNKFIVKTFRMSLLVEDESFSSNNKNMNKQVDAG